MRRLSTRIAALAVAALALSCKGGEKAPRTPLSYDGATSISRHILPEAIPAFQQKTGITFGKVDYGGGGRGLERLFAGEVAVAGVARQLTADELAKRPYIQIIGHDVLGVFVHEGNGVKGLSKAQLKAIFTGAIVNWKDVGGPNRPITPCTEPLRSGRNTLAVLQSVILDDAPFGPVRESPDPADCLAFVGGNPGGVTVATIAYAIPGVRPVPLDGVAPTPEAAWDASYLLSRPLLLVTRSAPTGDAAAFVEFMRSPEGQAIVGKKFIPAR